MNIWVLIFWMMVVTFGVRYPVLALLGRMELPRPVIRALSYVPISVLTAITVPAMLFPTGEGIDMGLDNAYLYAGIISVIISWRTKKLLPTILIGMAVFLMWRFVLPF